MKWEQGRQGTGYRKMTVAQGKWWDLHLIDYPRGIYIPWHVDTIDGKRHLRINLALRTGGSKLFAEETLFRFRERLVVFYSDRFHVVTPTESRRFVVSIGLALPNRA